MGEREERGIISTAISAIARRFSTTQPTARYVSARSHLSTTTNHWLASARSHLFLHVHNHPPPPPPRHPLFSPHSVSMIEKSVRACKSYSQRARSMQSIPRTVE